jgi:hypothetical protein
MPLKVWQDPVHQDRVQLALVLDQKVASLDQVDQDLVVQVAHVQDLVLRNQEWVVAHQEASRVVLQQVEEVAELAAAPQVLSVKVAHAVNLRLESQSAPREKNSNKEVSQVLVEQLFQEAMAQR